MQMQNAFAQFRVSDRMTVPVPVITPVSSVQGALRLMRDHRLTALPVCEEDRFIGLVSEKDLLDLTPSRATTLSRFEIGALLDKVAITDAMRQPAVLVAPDTPLREAAALMVKHSAEVLCVVENRRLAGVISWMAVLAAAIEEPTLAKAG
jgi:acetoin utilization protein AcuB